MRNACAVTVLSIALGVTGSVWAEQGPAATLVSPSASGTYTAIKTLRDAGRFAEFDAGLRDLAVAPLFPDRRPPADVAWTLLGTFQFDALDPPRLDALLRDWGRQAPASPYLAMTRARLLATAARRDVQSPLREARQRAEAQLAEALRLLRDLAPDVQASELWHIAMLHVLGSRGRPDGSEGSLAADAVRRWPLDLHFHRVILRRLHPDGGGSWRHVERFIGEAADRVADTEGDSLYARLYTELPVGDLAARRTALDAARLERGFVDWQARDAAAKARNLHATHACVARDKTAFLQVIRDLAPGDLQPSQWLPGHGPEACRRWAGLDGAP